MDSTLDLADAQAFFGPSRADAAIGPLLERHDAQRLSYHQLRTMFGAGVTGVEMGGQGAVSRRTGAM